MTITTSQFIAVNVGATANDGTGDDLRTAFTKINENFANISDVGYSAANISVTGDVVAVGNITAANVTASDIIATNLYGLIQTPTQSQITSLGTLTGLTSSGIAHITNTTQSLQFNSGAVVIDGGLGVAKDVYIQGNLYVANAIATSVTTLVSTSPLVFFDTIPSYPYTFDIGFYGNFTGGVGNVNQYTGFVRNDADHRWNLFSNVAVPSGNQMSLTNAKYDTLVLGNIVLNAPTPTAITNGGTTATGNIGASGATFNYGYFTNLTGTLQTATQNNITSASTLATVGTITSGTWSGSFGAVSGANLTNLTAANLTGTIPSAVLGNSTVYIGTTAVVLNRTTALQALTGVSIDGAAGSVAASAITGTALPTSIVTSSLTSVGTLIGIASSGVIRTTAAVASTSTTTGALIVTGGAGISGDINAGNNITATYHTGTLVTAAQPNITTVGTLGSLAVTGNISAGNVVGTHYGNSIGTTAAYTGNISANYFTGSGALLTGVVTSNVGTLTSLTVTGAITVNSSNAVTAIINGGTTGVGNIGSATVGFNTIFAKATSAVYADLAENYLSDVKYEAGTVVVFGGAQEITTTVMFADATVAGVISTDPAYLMNSASDGQPVALRGRVPVKVQGFTRKGDLLVTGNIPGTAVSVGRDIKYGQAVFAKALENKTTAEVGIIEAVII